MEIQENTKKELGIYIHIPFCKQKCYYCDFTSFCNKDNIVEKYIECIKKEIQNKLKQIDAKDYLVTSIYIGGGTPSYIEPEYIESILYELKSEIKTSLETTIEVNPGTVTRDKLEKYKKIGINRISIGLQEVHNTLLKQIGRIHSFEEFENTYKLARKIGFKNINVDLIFGLPNQTINDLKESLEYIVNIQPEHISTYSLIVEEGTVLQKKIKEKALKLPDEDTERQMYWYIKNTLELKGYNHYEISNFAKKGHESLHNTNCWKQKEYIGFGVAAHSYFNDRRFSNKENLEEYINNIENGNIEKNTYLHEIQNEEEKQREYMLLGLRTIKGISIKEFKNRFKLNPIFLYHNELEFLVNEKLLNIDGDYIKLTNRGIDLANVVWEKFV